MAEWLVLILMFAGSFFILTAAIGILRMPDLFMRMSASAKAGTLGAGLMLVGVSLFFESFSITTRAFAVITFLLITAPVAAHMIARAAYFDGIPLWKGTIIDELKSHYHLSTHELDSSEVNVNDQLPESTDADFEGDDFQTDI